MKEEAERAKASFESKPQVKTKRNTKTNKIDKMFKMTR